MENYSRVILNKKGKDIGLREDNRGAIFIEPKIYFKKIIDACVAGAR